MAREVERFAHGARRSIQEFKAEITAPDPRPDLGTEKAWRQRHGQKPAKKPLKKEEP